MSGIAILVPHGLESYGPSSYTYIGITDILICSPHGYHTLDAGAAFSWILRPR
jgi:hypothetical protein